MFVVVVLTALALPCYSFMEPTASKMINQHNSLLPFLTTCLFWKIRTFDWQVHTKIMFEASKSADLQHDQGPGLLQSVRTVVPLKECQRTWYQLGSYLKIDYRHWISLPPLIQNKTKMSLLQSWRGNLAKTCSCNLPHDIIILHDLHCLYSWQNII